MRRQIGAQLLRAPSNVREVLYGLSMWITGGGDQIDSVVSAAELHFDGSTADLLVQPLVRLAEAPSFGSYRLAQVAVAVWDELSDDVFRVLLGHLQPGPGLDPAVAESRRLWAFASVRLPIETGQRLILLEADTQLALLEELPLEALLTVPDQIVAPWVRLLEDSELQTGALVSAEGILRRRAGLEPHFHPGLAAEEVADVALRDPESVPVEALEAAERELLATLRRQLEQALAGSYGFGRRPTTASLSLVARARGAVAPETLQLLREIASDVQVLGDFRFEALLALGQLAADGLMPTDFAAEVAAVPEHSAGALFAPTPPELLRVARLLVRAQVLDAAEEAQVFALARDRDPRVRQLALNTAGLALRGRDSPVLESAVIAGLFDPVEEVLLRALASLREAELKPFSFDDSIVRRLETLFSDYGRDVRAATVQSAKAVLEGGRQRPELTALIERAHVDRSWLVRNAAAGVI